MLPKNLQSNLPLSGDSRARLLKLRARQLLELASIKESIYVDRASIAENESAITVIERAIMYSKAALATYNSNINSLNESKSRLISLSPTYKEVSTPIERDPLPTYRRAYALIASSISSDLQYVDEQKKHSHSRVVDVNSILSSLERELHGYKVELVLNESSLTAHTTFMDVTSSSLKAIKEVLSPMKQVPSEVWEDIFRMVLVRVGGNTGHMLSLSQVCREWRAISIGCAGLWTHTVTPAVAWWPQAEMDRFQKLLSLAREKHPTLSINLYEQRKWETQALASEKLGRLYLHEEHSFFVLEAETITYPTSPLARRGQPSHEDLLSLLTSLPPPAETKAKKRRRVQKFKPTYQHGYVGTERYDLVPITGTLPHQQYTIHFYSGGEPTEGRHLSIPFNKPYSITIEAPSPRQDALLNILSSFHEVSRLILLNIWPNAPNQLIGKLQEVKYLRFSTSSMASFDISPLLPLSLEEFHVQHSCDNTFPRLASTIALPKLHTLAITLHEHSLCSMLEFPTLRTLILHSSAPARDLASSSDFFKSKSHFGRISHLRFCDWDGMDGSSTVIEIVKNIMMASTHLTELTFTNCRLEMPNLIPVVISIFSGLKVINLVCCVGITRADCESLRLKVETLRISV